MTLEWNADVEQMRLTLSWRPDGVPEPDWTNRASWTPEQVEAVQERLHAVAYAETMGRMMSDMVRRHDERAPLRAHRDASGRVVFTPAQDEQPACVIAPGLPAMFERFQGDLLADRARAARSSTPRGWSAGHTVRDEPWPPSTQESPWTPPS